MKKRCLILTIFTIVMLCCGGCRQEEKVPEESMEESTEESTVVKPLVLDETGSSQAEEAIVEETSPEELLEQEVEALIQTMTLEEKVAQLFVVLPESIVEGVDCVTAAGDATKQAIASTPVGGFIYMSGNLLSEEQTKTMLANVQMYSMERSGFPAFLCVDEEGGTVTRVSGTGKFDVPVLPDMSVIGQSQDTAQAYDVGVTIGGYLAELGFNVDFAPVADVLVHPDNQVVRRRSFGSDPQLVADMTQAVAQGLKEQGILGAYKHFPGHGGTAGDTHEGYAYTNKGLEELRSCEWIPFENGIANEIPFIMVGHISLPNVIGDNTPASLSDYIITELLRNQLGYQGIVITDAMNMGAIVQQYSSAEAAVKALQAGVDVLLMPADFRAAYNGVLQAVSEGLLTEERIEESLKRILHVKLQMKKQQI